MIAELIPELGKYAGAVLSSYGVSIVLLLGLAWMSFARARRVTRQLEQVEAQVQTRRASDG